MAAPASASTSTQNGKVAAAGPSRPVKSPRRRVAVSPTAAALTNLPAFPPLTPFVTTVSARVLKEAESQLETLKREVEELKRKDLERSRSGPVIEELPDIDPAEFSTARELLAKQIELQYLLAREEQQKQLQARFLARREELERLARDAPLGPWIEPWKDQKGSGKEVVVVSAARVPGFSIAQNYGTIQAIVPRSRLVDKSKTPFLADVDLDEDDLNTFANPDARRANQSQVASIIRTAALETLIKYARAKGANAILRFEYRARIKPDSDREIVEVMARGQAALIKRLPEHLVRQQIRESEQESVEGLRKALSGLLQKRQPSRDERLAEQVAQMVRLTNGGQRYRRRDGPSEPREEDSASTLLRSLMKANNEGGSSGWGKPSRGSKVRFDDQWGPSSSNAPWSSSARAGQDDDDWFHTDFSGSGWNSWSGENDKGKGKAKDRSIEDALVAAMAGVRGAPRTSDSFGGFFWEEEQKDEKEKERPIEREREFTWS